MAAHGVDADRAFKMLVERSQRENVKLYDVAHGVFTTINQA